jgi:excisionase family DNA binding protein
MVGNYPEIQSDNTHAPLVPKMLYTRQEAAEALSLSIRTIDSLTANQELRVVRVGSSVRIPVESLRAFMRRDHSTGRVQ